MVQTRGKRYTCTIFYPIIDAGHSLEEEQPWNWPTLNHQQGSNTYNDQINHQTRSCICKWQTYQYFWKKVFSSSTGNSSISPALPEGRGCCCVGTCDAALPPNWPIIGLECILEWWYPSFHASTYFAPIVCRSILTTVAGSRGVLTGSCIQWFIINTSCYVPFHIYIPPHSHMHCFVRHSQYGTLGFDHRNGYGIHRPSCLQQVGTGVSKVKTRSVF